MPSVPEMIRTRAAELGQSDEAIARSINVGSSTVTRWRQGKISPRLDKVPALARWLGISEGELLAALSTAGGPSLADVAVELRGLRAQVQTLVDRVSQLERAAQEAPTSAQRPSRAPSC